MTADGQRSSVPELGREPALLAWIAERGVDVAAVVDVGGEPGRVAEVGPGPVALRSTYGSDAAVFAVVPGAASAGPPAREVWSSFVEALTGLPRLRFLAELGTAEEDVALRAATIVRAAIGEALADTQEGRVAQLIERLRARGYAGEFVAHTLAAASFGQLVSRDLRTGAHPARGQVASAPHALVESVSTFRPATELGASAARLAPLLDDLEIHTERPVRIAFLDLASGPVVVGVAALARAGRASFALAVDLVRRGAVDAARALSMVDVRDAPAALAADLERAPGDELVRGVAAGAGVLSGHVVTTPDAARALAAAGLPSVLVLAGADEDDLDGVHAADAIVATAGGITGHFAVVARGLGKPCLAAGSALTIDGARVSVRGADPLRAGARVTVDGGAGVVVRGAAVRVPGRTAPETAALLGWAEAPPIAALVAAPGDVTSARRAACEGVVVCGDSVALAAHAADAPLGADLDALFAAIAAEGFTRATIAPPRFDPAALVALVPRHDAVTDDALEAFTHAARQAAARHGVAADTHALLDASALDDERLAGSTVAGAAVRVTPAQASRVARTASASPRALACLPEHARAVRLGYAASRGRVR